MSRTTIPGELEIDHERGVIYFHTSNRRVVEQYGTVTILRVQVGKEIPQFRQIDIAVGRAAGSNYGINETDAGRTLAAYVYAIENPGNLPVHVRNAMRVFEG